MIVLFCIFAAVLIYFSLRSFVGGIGYLKYAKQEMRKPASTFTPFVTVIVPCKGLDQGFAENFAPLLTQDYPRYEVIFVVDGERDPAIEVINEVRSDSKPDTKLVIAPKASCSSQKVENLRHAVLEADPLSEIFVFVDSDARPRSVLLRSLAAPLADEKVGIATGYRWFISNRPSFASELRSAWNASIASSLGPNSSFCWAGSMAVRRETFERLNVRQRWKGTVSDDFTLARVIKEAGLTIRYVPTALTPSIENCTFRELLEFTTRQMKLTRVYSRRLWLMSFFGSAVFNVALIWAFFLTVTANVNGLAFFAAVTTIVLVFTFSIAKAHLRWKAVKLLLVEHSGQIRRQFWWQNTLWLLTPMIFLGNCMAAAFSRTINWRGTVYEMVSPTETRILTQPKYLNKRQSKVL